MALPYPPINSKPIQDNTLSSPWLFFIKGIFNICGSGVGKVFFTDDGIESTEDLNITPSNTSYIMGYRFDTPTADDVGSILSIQNNAFVYLRGGTDIALQPTGSIKLGFFGTSIPDGWVLLNDGTVGNSNSLASTRANADTEELFTLIWNNISDTDCPVSGGRGGSAAADFSANKTIRLPLAAGRLLGAYGAGTGLTSRALGSVVGTETHPLTTGEIPSHTHNIVYGSSNAVNFTPNTFHSSNILGGERSVNTTRTTAATGSDTPHNNIQPTIFMNAIIKL